MGAVHHAVDHQAVLLAGGRDRDLLAGLSGLVTALGTIVVNPIAGALAAIASFAGMLVGILFARIVAEFILMVFRINEVPSPNSTPSIPRRLNSRDQRARAATLH